MPSLPITPKYEPGPEIGISTPMRITRSCANALNAMAAANAAIAVLSTGFMDPPRCERQSLSPDAVQLTDLGVEGPQVVEQAEQEQAPRQQIDDAGDPLAHVKTVDAEDAEEGQQDPRDVVADRTRRVAQLCGAFHPGDEKHVDQPADAEQPEREEPDRARDRPAEIEPVRSGEAENPKGIADQLAVRVVHFPMVRSPRSPENVAPSSATERWAWVTDGCRAMRRARRP